MKNDSLVCMCKKSNASTQTRLVISLKWLVMYYILPTRFIYDIVKLTKGFCIVDQQKNYYYCIKRRHAYGTEIKFINHYSLFILFN